MSRRVYLHIGAPKTGTTYLQDRLAINARSLAEHQVHVPTRSPLVSPGLFHFRAALDLLDQDWGGAPGHAEGSWDALVRRVRRRSGTVVISHEILAPAPTEKVEEAKRALGSGDTELHVVYSARDLARQLPAAWQESIKQGRKWTYRRFLSRVQDGKPWFYRAFDLPTVLSRWGAGLPPEHVHLVTVPPAASREGDPDLLWRRFCRAIDINPTWAPQDSGVANPSLGMAETQLLRRLNRRMDRATRREAAYDELIRELLAQSTLAERRSRPVTLPPRLHEWVATETDRWVDWVEQSGIDVIGDLADLRSEGRNRRWEDPDKVPAKKQLDAAVHALAVMTREAARRPDPDQQLVRKVRTQAKRLREP